MSQMKAGAFNDSSSLTCVLAFDILQLLFLPIVRSGTKGNDQVPLRIFIVLGPVQAFQIQFDAIGDLHKMSLLPSSPS